MATSYAYAVGSLRVRETALLTRTDFEQLLAAGDEETLIALLRDRGFGDGSPSEGIDGLLRQETEKLWAYLCSLTPESALWNTFWIRNDAHNCKAVFKGVLADRPYRHLLLGPSTIPAKALETAANERRFGELPEWLAEAAAQAYDILAHTGDIPRGDAVIDRAAMEEMLRAAEATRVGLLSRLMTAMVFYDDVKIAIRAARTGKDAAFLDLALCPCPGVDRTDWKRAVLSGEVLELLERLPDYRCREAVEQYRASPAAFEKWVDDYLLSIAREGKYVALGAEPLIGYLMARETEIKALHMLASGLRTGQHETELRERMRMLYA